ncbi:hypothetical protein [Streptomyces sp. V3I7]|uniref:hypothetical protein n=1 Tax=Streptomyces sp. V3I7 TaxID=3042278 RepID=UPI0027830D44|nr:hypothetical protein [Streptomyces sp. V3I7]MDQ0994771.1 hypothetical protein [Streptomyces sp. V3I7]
MAAFAIELRRLREECGRPTYRQLATLSAKVGSPYSDTTFSTAARGHTAPSRAVVMAYVRACLAYTKADEEKIASAVDEWDTRWKPLEVELAPARPSQPAADSAAAPEPDRPSPSTSEGSESEQTDEQTERPVVVTARWFADRRKPVLMFLAGIAAMAGLGLGARYIAPPGSAAADSVPPVAAPPGASLSAAGLGGNSRCGRLRYVNGLTWSPCTRVEGTKLVFAVQISNRGKTPVAVKAKLSYVRAGVAYGCPGSWGAGVDIKVPPGETVISPLAACTVTKLPATAFQAKAWVITPTDRSWGYREMSQTVHIQPDGVKAIWADEA